MTNLISITEPTGDTSQMLSSVAGRYSRQSLATEEFGTEGIISAMAQTLGFVKQSFTKLADTLTDFTKTPKISTVQPWSEVEQRRFSREIQNLNYFTFSDMKIAYSPEGMYKTYLEYLGALRPLCEHVSVCHNTIIHPYVKYLGGLLSEVGGVIKTTKDNTAYYKQLEENRESMKDALFACYKPASEQDVRRVSEVVKRNADWQNVFTQINESVRMTRSIDVKKIQDDVNLACTYIDSIIARLESQEVGQIQNSNKEVLTVLSSGAYQMSCEVELIPMIIFKTELAASAIMRTAQSINNTVLSGKGHA